jgi:hypothetical protein
MLVLVPDRCGDCRVAGGSILASTINLGVCEDRDVASYSFVASRGPAMRELGNFVVSILIVLLPMALVFRQPDLGTSLVYGVIWVAVLALAQTKRRYWFAIGAATPVMIFVAWEFFLAEYQRRRWTIFLNPEADARGDGFNLIQARISIGSGGLRGFGIEGGTQSQLGLLKVRESDFIFAHASGMFGFIGMLALMDVRDLALAVPSCIGGRAGRQAGPRYQHHRNAFLPGFRQHRNEHWFDAGDRDHITFVSSGLSSLWTFLIAEESCKHPDPTTPWPFNPTDPVASASMASLYSSERGNPVIDAASRAAWLALRPDCLSM